ncbi:MAG: hypothetical protein CM15mP44_9350 [Candidatus Neomarinimicrobiota bacterium]|nr:MAG: hypothetical protein CM15mP44_9350 [Candidatus Neomarinimicrobiota bacterium]
MIRDHLLIILVFDKNQFDDPFVIHGGEGFAHITGDGIWEATQEWAFHGRSICHEFFDLNKNGKQTRVKIFKKRI